MPRNGAGTFAVINPILVGTLRSSSKVNANFTDMGSEITGTIPLSGVAGMSGQFKAADGSALIPGICFANDTNTGFRRSNVDEMRWVAGGQDRFYVDANGKAWALAAADITGAIAVTGSMTGSASDPILISQLSSNGAAKRTGNPVWAAEPYHYIVHFKAGGFSTVFAAGVIYDVQVPVSGTIVSASLSADQTGSLVVDIWKDTYANYPPTVADTITASAKPTISSGTKSLDSTLTGWTTSVSAGDCLRFNIDSCSSITRFTLSLAIKRYV